MGKKKSQGTAIGRSIIKERFGHGHKSKSNDSFLHTSELDDGYEWGRLNLQSVTEQSNLEEFLTTAELAGTEFTAEKLNIQFIDPKRAPGLSESELEQIKNAQNENRSLLRIPRRPGWNESTTAEELDMLERNSFLEWRRNLASLQEKDHIVMTPYEKNLDFWRQLWRVTERSDIIVQIVDARNPLLFRCEDIEKYVREVKEDKVNLLLVNKADYLSQDQRAYWSEYFTKENIRVVFWSALYEAERQKENDGEKEADEERSDSDNEDMDADQDGEMEADEEETETAEMRDTVNPEQSERLERKEEIRVVQEERMESESNKDLECDAPAKCDIDKSESQTKVNVNHANLDRSTVGDLIVGQNVADFSQSMELVSSQESDCGDNSRTDILKFNRPDIVSGPELLDIFRELHVGEKYKEGVTTVGMIGYPNVGKSSTINAILQMKKVPVSATPGRTKHFQTLFVEPTLMLCDCPGLVFPSFVSTKADLVVNGILPIDQLRDHIAPTSLICERIPRATLEAVYGVNIPLPEDYEGEDMDVRPTAHELLNAYGLMRGFMTANGQPDGPRSSRYILKDYVNGKLLYCEAPPGVSKDNFKPTPVVHRKSVKKTEDQSELSLKPRAPRVTSVDKDFFKKTRASAHSKGTRGVSGYIRTQGLQQVSSSSSTASPHSSQSSLLEKPWKKHNNRNKKEKLRKVYSDHDN